MGTWSFQKCYNKVSGVHWDSLSLRGLQNSVMPLDCVWIDCSITTDFAKNQTIINHLYQIPEQMGVNRRAGLPMIDTLWIVAAILKTAAQNRAPSPCLCRHTALSRVTLLQPQDSWGRKWGGATFFRWEDGGRLTVSNSLKSRKLWSPKKWIFNHMHIQPKGGFPKDRCWNFLEDVQLAAGH